MRRPVKVRGKWCYKYDKAPSVYWNGRWQDIKVIPTGYRWRWSDKAIRPPNGEASNDKSSQDAGRKE